MRVRSLGAVFAVTVAAAGLWPGTTSASSGFACQLPGPEDETTERLMTATGFLGSELEGSFVYVPFEVPEGTTGIRVRYCHDQPESIPSNPAPNSPRHTIDLGVYDAPDRGGHWEIEDIRGWAGSAIRDVTIAENGYSEESVYEADRKGYVSGVTTRGYDPGGIEPGRWAVELGVAAVTSQSEGDSDGAVGVEVVVETTRDPSWADDPHRPTGYDGTPASRRAEWYAGDFHVHGEQEPGNATVRETLEYSFGEYGGEGAGLDFVTLLDHNNINGHTEIGRHQGRYPDKLIMRSTEVTTYRGHIQSHVGGNIDFRTGPQYVKPLPRDGFTNLNTDPGDPDVAPRQAAEIFADIRAAGGFGQINHPTIFPDAIPTFDDFCRGCAWGYTPAETDYGLVDTIEISTGPAGLKAGSEPGPNPFTPLALQFWEDAIDSGGTGAHRIAAVGSSDSHQAPKRAELGPSDATTAPIGQATTMVFAEQLSERGIREAIRDRHTYVRLFGLDGPEISFEAFEPGTDAPAGIIGDAVAADALRFEARLGGLERLAAARPGQLVLSVVKDGSPISVVPVPPGADSFEHEFESSGPGRYRLQVDRTAAGGAAIEAVTSHIWHDPVGSGGDPEPEPADCELPLTGTEAGDRLVGGPSGDRLLGLAGGDSLHGRQGADCLLGQDGADRVLGGAGPDLVAGGRGRDSLAGAGGTDRVRGGRSADQLSGAKGDDRLNGGRGGDLVRGGRGDDLLRGHAGDDRLVGGAGADVLRPGGGRDTVRAGGGDDRIRAADGRSETIRCGAGVDRVSADRGDRLRGCERVRRS